MDDRFDYARDFYSWSQQQAERLRDLAVTHRDLPNDLDIENIAEEIESVGRSELAAVRSLLLEIMAHLIKLSALPDDGAPVRHWRSEIRNFSTRLQLRYSPGMRQNLDLERTWELACAQARDQLEDFGDSCPSLPKDPPFEICELISQRIDIETLVARLRSMSN